MCYYTDNETELPNRVLLEDGNDAFLASIATKVHKVLTFRVPLRSSPAAHISKKRSSELTPMIVRVARCEAPFD